MMFLYVLPSTQHPVKPKPHAYSAVCDSRTLLVSKTCSSYSCSRSSFVRRCYKLSRFEISSSSSGYYMYLVYLT